MILRSNESLKLKATTSPSILSNSCRQNYDRLQMLIFQSKTIENYTNLVRFGQSWSDLVKFGQIWSDLV